MKQIKKQLLYIENYDTENEKDIIKEFDTLKEVFEFIDKEQLEIYTIYVEIDNKCYNICTEEEGLEFN